MVKRIGWRGALLIGVVVGLAAGGAVARAAIPGSTSGVITACYPTSGASKGVLRVINADGGKKCSAGQAKLQWPSTSYVRSVEAKTEVAVTSVGGADSGWVSRGGPTVAVVVPSSGLVEWRVRAETRGLTCPPPYAAGRLAITVDGGPPDADHLVANVCSAGYTVAASDWITVELSPGVHHFTVVYAANGNGTPSPDFQIFFRNRKLWAMPIG